MTAYAPGYVYRRCHRCSTVYRWPDAGLPIHRARCPQCLQPLHLTSASWAGRITTLEHQP